jgi:nitrous oxidase accessory protein NosD
MGSCKRVLPAVFFVVVVAAALLALVGATSSARAAAHDMTPGLYVSPSGSPSNAGTGCGSATFTSINAAVAAAPSGGKVVACPGTYHEDVLVQKPLRLWGKGATIDATGFENAMQIVASNVKVRWFKLTNANGEGLLVGIDSFADIGLLPPSGPVLTNENIQHVRAIDNDKGFTGAEQANCKYPGDCGGGIHLNVVEHSVVGESVVNDNADGILLTDDYGPNAHNLIEHNIVNDNKTECGIVLPSHSSNAVNYVVNQDGSMTVTGRNPDQGGVYDNIVRGNITEGNGTAPAPPEFGGVGGSGSGIGIFGSGPGSGAYDNLVEDNYVAGNGLAGVTLHAHHPGGEDINGNEIVGNWIEKNNVAGDAFDGGVSNFATTAVAVYSVPSVQMVIRGNVFRHNAIGVWLTNTVTAAGLGQNSYRDVPQHVFVSPPN